MSLVAIYFRHVGSYMARKVDFTKSCNISYFIAYNFDVNLLFDNTRNQLAFSIFLWFQTLAPSRQVPRVTLVAGGSIWNTRLPSSPILLFLT
jgi:hypothetical protein